MEPEKELGLYEIELVDGVVVLVCNLCNTGFEMDDGIEKHLKDIHSKSLGVVASAASVGSASMNEGGR